MWEMLGLSRPRSRCAGRAPGRCLEYWKAQEGEFALTGVGRRAAGAGHEPPVVHLDQSGAAALRPRRRLARARRRGASTSASGRTGTGVTGGGLPVLLTDPSSTPTAPTTRPTPPSPAFAEFFTSGLAAAFGRFARPLRRLARRPRRAASSPTRPTTTRSATGSLPNAYAIVDSGHGFKMLALGRLAADDVLEGEPRLEPFRLGRFERGETHIASRGPYPWT